MLIDRSLLGAAAVLGAVLGMGTSAAYAATEIQWWHAMGGAQRREGQGDRRKASTPSQGDYVVTPVFKGTYTETMTAAIAAFRAGEQPAIVQVFEVGTGDDDGGRRARSTRSTS